MACVVIGCGNSQRSRPEGVSFHKDGILLRIQPPGEASGGQKKSDLIKIFQTCIRELDTTASILKVVRKRKLFQLMQQEMEDYDKEFRALGKCFSPAIHN